MEEGKLDKQIIKAAIILIGILLILAKKNDLSINLKNHYNPTNSIEK